jgi:putative endonuclease
MAEHNDIGRLGEDIAVKFLMKRGLTVITRNYWKKWGEIDIVACGTPSADKKTVHFIEVKSTAKPYTCNTSGEAVDSWQPEEMVHARKIQRLQRVIQTYIIEYDVEEWVFDVVIVYINKEARTAKCKYIEDIVL